MQTTFAPVSTDASAPLVDAPAGSSASVSVPSPSPVPIHSAQAGSSTFRLMDNVVCPQSVLDTVYAVYGKNKALFLTCIDKSGYQIFPYSGKVPTAEDTALMVRAPECMGVITAVALANLPACSLSGMPLKAVVETLLKISVDMADGSAAPSAIEFHALMAWRRDVDLAYEAGLPHDGDSELFGIFNKALWRALASTKVRVLSDWTVVLDSGTTATFADATGSAVAETVAKVQASDASGSMEEQVRTPSATEATAAKSSSAAAPRATRFSAVLLAVLSSLLFAL